MKLYFKVLAKNSDFRRDCERRNLNAMLNTALWRLKGWK